MGTLLTFYSYKGGVGRTMALANIAVLLAMWGKKVLIVDWDLEAPGVEHFLFKGTEIGIVQKRDGLIDLLTVLSEKGIPRDPEDSWRHLLVSNRIQSDGGQLSLLTAGARTQGYFRNVRKLDVKAFYEHKNGGHIIETLRNSWRSKFDFVLVDSRTGITDIGGICTIQLPDILVLVFTATQQSLAGVVEVANNAATERQKLPFDRSLVPSVPIPSRFDTQTEHKIAKDWLDRFEQALEPIYKQWLPKGVSRHEFLELTKIPYTPFFSFGECLPVLEQGTTDPAGLGYAYETVAALIGNNLQHVDLLLAKNRDEFVRLARSPVHLAKTPLRELALPCVLLIDAVGSSRLAAGAHERVLAQFHSFVTDYARKGGGVVAMSTGDGLLVAFPEVLKAIRCALAIAEVMAVTKPISTPLGPLRTRMAIHAVREVSEHNPTMETLFPIVARIVSKAPEGEILTSGAAKSLVSNLPEDVEFKLRYEQVELDVAKGAPHLEDLYEVVGTTKISLNQREQNYLFAQDSKTKGGGGFQALLVSLHSRFDPVTGSMKLTISDRERIARYAHDYKGGGWQGRLQQIFGRTLGSDLGREKGPLGVKGIAEHKARIGEERRSNGSGATRLYVGNLSNDTTENDLQAAFAAAGVVVEIDMPMDKFSGRPRGYAFVTMETKEAAEAAIRALHGTSIGGRELTVNEARPREERALRRSADGDGSSPRFK